MNDVKTCGSGSCGSMVNKCKMMKAVLIVVFGLLFFAKAMMWVSAETVNIVWPILVIIGGLGKFCPCKNCAGQSACCK